MDKYDVVIIGGGIGGLMCAYRLNKDDPNLSILVLERGNDINTRHCPIIEKKTKKCMHCNPCAIMEGLAGAGAFSDGKYNITHEYGGWLQDFVPVDELYENIYEANDILVSFGATEELFEPDDELKKECLKYDLHMQQARVKHLGTDANLQTMNNFIDYLRDKVTFITNATVTDINKDKHIVSYTKNNQQIDVYGEYIIAAVGRAGSSFFQKWCVKNGIECSNNQVDVGVRVELPYLVWEKFSKKIYEPKIIYYTKKYNDKVRMFCFNERGHVVTENTDGVLTVNGHAYKDPKKKSENSNFALLSSSTFTEPFYEPIEYAKYIASLANKLSGGSVLVQRLGDLKNGKRTTVKRLQESSVKPTLDAVPGDLALCIPKRQLDNIIETLDALNNISPGTNNYDTLLYGLECKYYSARPKAKNFELDTTKNIYALGDGAGFTRSLSQSAANGLIVAKEIIKKKKA